MLFFFLTFAPSFPSYPPPVPSPFPSASQNHPLYSLPLTLSLIHSLTHSLPLPYPVAPFFLSLSRSHPPVLSDTQAQIWSKRWVGSGFSLLLLSAYCWVSLTLSLALALARPSDAPAQSSPVSDSGSHSFTHSNRPPSRRLLLSSQLPISITLSLSTTNSHHHHHRSYTRLLDVDIVKLDRLFCICRPFFNRCSLSLIARSLVSSRLHSIDPFKPILTSLADDDDDHYAHDPSETILSGRVESPLPSRHHHHHHQHLG